jgi:hypothetical protein
MAAGKSLEICALARRRYPPIRRLRAFYAQTFDQLMRPCT